MDGANKRMLEALGKAGEGFVKLNTPVASGALRDSIDSKVDDKSVFVGSTLTSESYPIFIEKGTSRMPAQPYLSTGIMNNLSQLKKIAERNYKL
jgi:HK97 gp10 family phage protein